MTNNYEIINIFIIILVHKIYSFNTRLNLKSQKVLTFHLTRKIVGPYHLELNVSHCE